MLKSNFSKTGERGSSTLEFIFCAPLLLIVMFVAMELNERIEQRVTSAIASGNSAWLVRPQVGGAAVNSEAEDLGKADILGTKNATSTGVLGVQNSDVLHDSSTVMSYSDSRRRADAYALKIDRLQNDTSDQHAKARSGVKIGDSTMDAVAAGLGKSANAVEMTMRKFVKPPVSWLPTVFPLHAVEEHRLSWGTSSVGSTNLALKTIEGLALSVGSKVGDNLGELSDKRFQLLAHHTRYLRRDPQFHPDEYVNGPFLGVIAGSSAFDKFIKNCFMKFVVDQAECGQKNGFYNYVARLHGLLVMAKTLVDSATIACIAATLGMGTGGCIVTKVQVFTVESILDAAVDEVFNQVSGKLSDLIDQKIDDVLGSITDKLEEQIENAMNGIKKKVEEAAGKTLDEPQ